MRNSVSLKLIDITTIFAFFQRKFFFFYNKKLTNNQYFIEIFSTNLCRFFFLISFFFNDKKFYIIDLFTTKPINNETNMFYIFSSFSSSYRFILKKKKTNTIVDSISLVWAGVCWPERELSEFSGFLIKDLYDSRRLLSDYVDAKGFVTTHQKTLNYYNNIYGDILL